MEVKKCDYPDTITVIGEGAFSGIDIEQITITNPHTVIEAFAFTNCANLTHVFLPEQNNIVIKNVLSVIQQLW